MPSAACPWTSAGGAGPMAVAAAAARLRCSSYSLIVSSARFAGCIRQSFKRCLVLNSRNRCSRNCVSFMATGLSAFGMLRLAGVNGSCLACCRRGGGPQKLQAAVMPDHEVPPQM